MNRSSLRRWWGPAAAVACLVVLSGCGEPITPGGTSSSAGGASSGTPSSGTPTSGSTSPGTTSAAPTSGPWAKVDASKFVTSKTGLKYAVLKPGTGAVAKAGDPVQVHYTGWLQSDGKKFDSSRDRGEPIGFPLGQGSVIPGWDEGVAGMKVGEQRQLVIPANLGYGERGAGADIPPGATLVFDVELVKIGN